MNVTHDRPSQLPLVIRAALLPRPDTAPAVPVPGSRDVDVIGAEWGAQSFPTTSLVERVTVDAGVHAGRGVGTRWSKTRIPSPEDTMALSSTPHRSVTDPPTAAVPAHRAQAQPAVGAA
jgi:hypothetical protein